MQVKIETSFGSMNVEMSKEDVKKLMKYVCEHAEEQETLKSKRESSSLKEMNLTEKLSQFLEEYLIQDDHACTKAKDIYTAYVNWGIQKGVICMKKHEFFLYAKEKGLMQERGTVNGQSVHNVFKNQRIKEEV